MKGNVRKLRGRRELRLLCLLVPSSTGSLHAVPVMTLRARAPWVDVQGRWGLALPAGLYLRETFARKPHGWPGREGGQQLRSEMNRRFFSRGTELELPTRHFRRCYPSRKSD